jgi:hypothetical protein
MAADEHRSVTYLINDALGRYIESRNVSTFRGDNLKSAVADLMVLTMRKLKEKAQNDESVEVEIGQVYAEACASAGSSVGIGSYDSTNPRLRNRVLQELFGRSYIRQGKNSGKVTVTYLGKNRPEFV